MQHLAGKSSSRLGLNDIESLENFRSHQKLFTVHVFASFSSIGK